MRNRSSSLPESDSLDYDPALVASVCALDGGGKTEFGARAKSPVAYFSVDPNTRETIQKLKLTPAVFKDYEMPSVAFGEKADVQKEASNVMDDMMDDIKQCVKPIAAERGTIVLDTATEIFELALMADHGRSVQILPEMRTKTNYKYKSLINGLKRSGCNVVLLHRLRDKYENKSVRTREGVKEERVKVEGEYEREGFSKTGFIVNVEAFLFHDPTRDKGDQYGMQITRCTQRPILIGKDYWGEQDVEGETVRASSFEFLGIKVYKGTTLDNWR